MLDTYSREEIIIIAKETVGAIRTDSPQPWQMWFQNPATPAMEGIIFLHNYIFMYLIFILTLVTWMLARAVWLFWEENNQVIDNVTHNSRLEILWTVTPSIILLLIAIPSFSLIYSMEELARPMMTIKAIGRQWYWTYELDAQRRDVVDEYLKNITRYFDRKIVKDLKNIMANRSFWDPTWFEGKKKAFYYYPEKRFPPLVAVVSPGIAFDSYMLQEHDLDKGNLRLLEVDNRLLIPVNTHVRLLTTSSDVIHSWAVPSFGIKMDAVPGRLNQTIFYAKRKGIYYGQCSELCGVNHGFMPIVVEVVDHSEFTKWAREQSQLLNLKEFLKKAEIREIDVSRFYKDV